MIPYFFHPDAESDLDEAVRYYDNCSAGPGLDFALEIYASIKNVCKYPMAWPVLEGDVRRCQSRRFPYGVLYSVEKNFINILAIMHLHRKPGYWKDRI